MSGWDGRPLDRLSNELLRRRPARAGLGPQDEPVGEHGRRYRLHVVGQHVLATVGERPSLRDAKKRDPGARACPQVEPRVGPRLPDELHDVALNAVLDEDPRRLDDHERPPERVADAVDRDLVLLHALEQGGLRLRRRSVDLVDQEDVVEDGPGPELELVRALVEDVHPRHVRGKQVRRELDPREGAVERARERLRQHRLPHSREVLDDQMPFADEAEDAHAEGLRRRMDDLGEVLGDPPDDLRRLCLPSLPRRALLHYTSFSTSSRIAAAISSFGALPTRRSPSAETMTTSLSGASKPMSSRETSL